MDSLPNELMAAILSKLNIEHKFRFMRVCKRWKEVCEQEVRTHKRLAIRNKCLEPLFPLSADCHFDDKDVVPESIVSVKNKSCWSTLFNYLPSLTVVYVDCEAALFIRNMLDFCSPSLTCLLCPHWTFTCDHPLPQLVVLSVDRVSDASLRGLLVSSPNLAAIKFSRTDFRHWNILPNGLRSMTGGELDDRPFDRLFSSPAAETLELLTLRSSALHLIASYLLPQLRELEVGGCELMTDNVILNWAETLSRSKNLQLLHFSTPIDGQHLTSAALWNTFFAAIAPIRCLYLNLCRHRLDPMSQIISSLVDRCPNIEQLTLPYSNLTDSDMLIVSQLPVLKKFLLYSNSGPLTEKGVLALLTGNCATTLTYLHIYNNYKMWIHRPPMTTTAVKEKVEELAERSTDVVSFTLQYLDHDWRR